MNVPENEPKEPPRAQPFRGVDGRGAIRSHIERKIIVHKGRTVVFH
jgi:hypothetical protein